MKDILQLIKKENNQEYKDIYPKTFTDAVLDKHTGANLADILNSFNMYFIAYAGSKEVTRVLVPTNLRRKGLWITYIMLDDTIVTEYYNGSLLTDDAWLDSANWVNSMQPFDKFSKKNMTCRFDGFTDKFTSSKLMTVKQGGEIVFSTTDNRFYYLHRDVLYAYWEVKGKPSNTEFQYKDSVYTDKLFLCKDRAYVMYNGTLVDIARFTIDKELSLTSNNPIANSTVTKKINEVNADVTTALTLARELKEEGRFLINGNVTNNPDEEDITVEENKLKFKDKNYNAGEFSGLGRVYLRKNIVNGKNVLTQGMINKSNTIYIIQYDYDLDNEEINIPENCTLDFQGGSLKDGNINFNKTIIKSNDEDNIFKNINIFNGILLNDYVTVPNFSYNINGDCFDNALIYLKKNNILLKAKEINLNKDYDFKGIPINFNTLRLNNHICKLGGGTNIVANNEGISGVNYNQTIDIVLRNNVNDNSSIIIEACSGIKINIGYFSGDIIFQTNKDNRFIAYCDFTFKNVSGLIFKNNDDFNKGWINENRFFLNRSLKFIVEKSLWLFDHNQIYNGCFEGTYDIRLEKGTYNSFINIRNEGSRTKYVSKLYFSKDTQYNFYKAQQVYTGLVYDYGKQNIIVNSEMYFSKNIFNDNITLEDIKINYNKRFNLKLSDAEDSMVNNSSNAVFYYSPYFKLDSYYYAILDVTSVLLSNIAIGYELYDEEFNKIKFNNNVSYGIIITETSSYINNTEGFYIVQDSLNLNSFEENITNSYNKYLDNSHIVVRITNKPSSLQENDIPITNKVKYIRFIIGEAWYKTTREDKKIKSINLNVYKILHEYPYESDLIIKS